MPYYLNLAPNYDATLTPRIMTKRGFQLGGQFRYLLERGLGRRGGGNPAARPETGTDRYLLSWKHNQSFDPYVKGLSGYVNLNKVSDDTYFSDLSDRVAFTSLTTLPREGGLYVHERRRGASSRARRRSRRCRIRLRRSRLPYNRVPQVQATLSGNRLAGAHVVGHRRIRVFPPADADDGPARLCVADGRHVAAGRGVVRQCAHRRSRARVRPERDPARRAEPAELRDSDHVGRRRAGVRAGREGIRNRPASRRSSRARSTSTSLTATRATRRRSTRPSTISISRSCSRSTAISATIASATPTSFRSR